MKEQFRPQPENPKQNSPEAGAGPLGIPPPEPDQQPQGGGDKSPEHQSLPSVWDVLERSVRLNAPDIENRPQWPSEQYMREFDEVAQLEEELMENGTPSEKLIIKLQQFPEAGKTQFS